MSTAHATTRIFFINAALIREIVPAATAATPLRGKMTVVTVGEKKVLQLEIEQRE